jgi:hypothetical protein
MKPQDFGIVLTAFADVLEAAGASMSAQVRVLANVFEGVSASSVAAFLKQLNSALPIRDAFGGPDLGELGRVLKKLEVFLEKTAKASAISDVKSVQTFFSANPSMDLATFERLAAEAGKPKPKSKSKEPKPEPVPIRVDLVTRYRNALEGVVGNDEQFTATYDELSANQDLSSDEVVAIARELTGASPRNRTEALKKIRAQHQKIVTNRSKRKARQGRTAA